MNRFRGFAILAVFGGVGCVSADRSAFQLPTHFELRVEPSSASEAVLFGEGSIIIRPAIIYPTHVRPLPSQVLAPGGWVRVGDAAVVDRTDPSQADLRPRHLGPTAGPSGLDQVVHDGIVFGIRYQSVTKVIHRFQIQYFIHGRKGIPGEQAISLEVEEGEIARIPLPRAGAQGARTPEEQEPDTQDRTARLVEVFLKGKPDEASAARHRLFHRGAMAVLPLLEARRSIAEAADLSRLNAFIFSIKSGLARESTARRTFDALKKPGPELDLREQESLHELLEYLRDDTLLSIVLDPMVGMGDVLPKLELSEAPLWQILDALCLKLDLDYDVRYGIVWISRPTRLWAPPVPPSREEMRSARRWVASLASDSIERRTEASKALSRMGPRIVPLLEETARSSDSELAERARSLIQELTATARTHGRLPMQNHWRTQDLSRDDERTVTALDAKVGVEFHSRSIEEILSYLEMFLGLEMRLEGECDTEVTLTIKLATLGNVLEAITLPLGLDVRLDEGVITVFKRAG